MVIDDMGTGIPTLVGIEFEPPEPRPNVSALLDKAFG